MIDKEILLHIVDGPGAGITWMVLGFFAMIVFLMMLYYLHKDAFNEGKQAARKEGLENLNASIARLIHDQQELKQMFHDPMSKTRTPGE